MVRCPTCRHECADDNRFCAWCATALPSGPGKAAPADASSAETIDLGGMPGAAWGAPGAAPGAGGLGAPPGTRAGAPEGKASGVTPRTASTARSAPSSVDEGRFLPGTVVAGRYRIAGLLGRGGMGEVYRATDLTLGQAVALKFLPEALSRDDRALARFYNEVRVARQVTHPNVCRVYDIGETRGQHYISMEFVDGEDLASLLRRIGRLPVDKAVETSRKLCAGLAAAHEKGVLHRDLKPANVMIDGRGEVIIMDFGLAGMAEQLQSDIRSGTPAYMSPEQLAGTEVTVKSDIYALGLVMYELFTGKRAFEAASMMELMQMQERASPASITTVAKELDPAAERVIMRCLEPDPRLRPSSALAVAAGLPGGDPLAAAMAAGETPSPELVAAAGETEGIDPKLAVVCLVAVLAALVIVEMLAPSQSLTSKLPLENSPDALTRDAQSLLKSFGYTAKPADRAWGLEYDNEYVSYSTRHAAEAAQRWKNPAQGQPPIVTFWYRESPRPLSAMRGFNVVVDFSDPPMEVSGMVHLRTDLDGKLQMFEAVPPQVEAPPRQTQATAQPFDWNRLFQAAGLDMSRFQSSSPLWTPLANWDTRAAWTGSDPQTGAKLRVEAAVWRGRPVFFRIIGPWNQPERMVVQGDTGNTIPFLIVIYLALLAACGIAWRNVRAGRSDRRGALKLAAIYFACEVCIHFLETHHTATLQELDKFWIAISLAMVNSSAVWIMYLALEPWVRRKWPQTLIGWSRFTAQGLRDPLVGRDLLYGMGFGLLMALILLAGTAFHGNSGQPFLPPLAPLLGVRYEAAGLLRAVTSSLFVGLLSLFLLFVLRVVLRNQWIATVVYVAILGFIRAYGTITGWVDYPVSLLYSAVFALVLLRFGLTAAIAANLCLLLLEACPATPGLSVWYAGLALIPPVVVAVIALYGFRIALAGRPLIPPEPSA